MKEIVEACRANEFSDLVVLHEHRGIPGMYSLLPLIFKFSYFHDRCPSSHPLSSRSYLSLYPTQRPTTARPCPALKIRPCHYNTPHLILENFSTKLGKRIENILKFTFPVPREDSKRIITFNNDQDFINFRHHVFVKTSHKEVQLAEVGPRFEMRRRFSLLALL